MAVEEDCAVSEADGKGGEGGEANLYSLGRRTLV